MKALLYATLLLCFIFSESSSNAQRRLAKNLVYVDGQGVMRYTSNNAEASFFGVNYTVPFAYGYRSHEALGVDIEKAIDDDVYHMWRLGLNAFRVHVWDTEISDTAGNLIENEHLRLFEYLISRLKARKIKILITPIGFWGNGYPEPDEITPGFSHKYGKRKALINDTAIKAQENYLTQFFNHVNSYTGLTYENDPDVIATEINNEPQHTGPKAKVTDYVNRMVNAVRRSGWTKPIFYNISESPDYADAVAKANIDGVSFQWYPTGLVANRTLQGNYLPHVDYYKIPFGDTIPAYRNKARMVYEFDAGDVMTPVMYPAMARSFRTAGFQWATQFAYDPLHTAYANTEYQTHYLNLAHTPAKAISLLIASKVFQRVPRLKSYGPYPADTTFDVFRLSYINELSEMNSDEEFYYSNSTTSIPKNRNKLSKIAGVGSSPVINYNGTGAYFLDRVGEGIWRLEVMPDAIQVNDPFGKASPKKTVTKISWRANKMRIDIPGLGTNFSIKGLNKGNTFSAEANRNTFHVVPGTYALFSKQNQAVNGQFQLPLVIDDEFVAPKSSLNEPFVIHVPKVEVSEGRSFSILAKIFEIDSTAQVSVELRHSANHWKTISLIAGEGSNYSAEVPADMALPGLLNYRFIIRQQDSTYIVFPGGYHGYPYAWSEYRNDSYQTFIAANNSKLKLFNPNSDRDRLNVYNIDWRNNTIKYVSADDPKQLIQIATMTKPTGNNLFGWQIYFADKLRGRKSELNQFNKLLIKGRSENPTPVNVTLISKDGYAYSSKVIFPVILKELEMPLEDFKSDSSLLLPRPYPGFMPLYFRPKGERNFDLNEIEKLEITFGHDIPSNQLNQPLSIEIESVWLEKAP